MGELGELSQALTDTGLCDVSLATKVVIITPCQLNNTQLSGTSN